jgi:predicted DCC family thiol-disulfide oxidoreductase YuxK
MNVEKQTPNARFPASGWILYDGECGFCARWVHIWERTIAKRGFALKDLQSAWTENLLCVPRENLLDDIRVLTRNGEVFTGADACLYVTRRTWWAWPFYALFSLPGFNRTLRWGYREFARNRYCVSKRICGPHS